ncbi:hypothetical protein JTE90_020024 [Oedothorax gibbosus]|uniref:Uncharacterized protein n=1 Tax=Oedothorax gibbosus TaxID=931172 RepID=A0AAV6TZE3_9ARAC|nr:hypothetical protein JTE90_020024 [Oedothorax gibbosus]
MDPSVKCEPLSSSEGEETGAAGAAPNKQAASPAQEATRAHIAALERQLKKLKRGKMDHKVVFEMNCLEEDIRKAQSKLKRLLNEAQRQRRRRERLRGGGAAPRTSAPQVRSEDGVMSALRSCSRFQDFVRELNMLGFSISQHGMPSDSDDVMPEVNGVKVEVELIEGDEELSADDFSAQDHIPSSRGSPHSDAETDEQPTDANWRRELSHRRWFERQARLQRNWEETLMRDQAELAHSMLESVTATFLQGIQQVMDGFMAGRRFHPAENDA